MVLFDFREGSWPDLIFVSLATDGHSEGGLTTAIISYNISPKSSLHHRHRQLDPKMRRIYCLSERKSPAKNQPYASDKAQSSIARSLTPHFNFLCDSPMAAIARIRVPLRSSVISSPALPCVQLRLPAKWQVPKPSVTMPISGARPFTVFTACKAHLSC